MECTCKHDFSFREHCHSPTCHKTELPPKTFHDLDDLDVEASVKHGKRDTTPPQPASPYTLPMRPRLENIWQPYYDNSVTTAQCYTRDFESSYKKRPRRNIESTFPTIPLHVHPSWIDICPIKIIVADGAGGCTAHTLAVYTCSFRRHFLLQVESKYLATCGFHSWSQSQTVFDNWQRRLEELTKDALGILNIQLNIRKLRECDFNSHGEWIYRVPEKTSKNFYITGEREYQEMLKKAKEGNLPDGYLIRIKELIYWQINHKIETLEAAEYAEDWAKWVAAFDRAKPVQEPWLESFDRKVEERRLLTFFDAQTAKRVLHFLDHGQTLPKPSIRPLLNISVLRRGVALAVALAVAAAGGARPGALGRENMHPREWCLCTNPPPGFLRGGDRLRLPTDNGWPIGEKPFGQ